MAKEPRISDAELHVLELLWNESPLSATDVAERVDSTRGWSLSTVKTLLARLMAKGAISARTEGRRFLYRPKVERDAVATRQAARVVDRLFGGRVSPLVANLADQREINADDLAELEALIRSLKR